MALNLNANKFKLVGGAPSLDFVNTVAGRTSNPSQKGERDYLDFYRGDKFETYADLLAWSFKAGLIDDKLVRRLLRLAEKEPQTAGKVLRRALILRESLYRLFKSIAERWQPAGEDLRILNRELDIARRHRKFSVTKDGFGFEWIDLQNSLDAMLWLVVECAVQTLLTADLSRINQCGNHDCNWLFLDASRSRNRQWCDMKDCGNLAKVRRFRQKNQNAPA